MIDDETPSHPTSDDETPDSEGCTVSKNLTNLELCSGTYLLKSHEGSELGVPLSATVTIGSILSDKLNVHELAANLLNSTTTHQHQKETVTSTDDEHTYVVRL